MSRSSFYEGSLLLSCRLSTAPVAPSLLLRSNDTCSSPCHQWHARASRFDFSEKLLAKFHVITAKPSTRNPEPRPSSCGRGKGNITPDVRQQLGGTLAHRSLFRTRRPAHHNPKMEEFNFFSASNGASPFDSLNGDTQSFPSSPHPDGPFAEAKGVGKSPEPESRSATESVPASLFGNPSMILSQDSDPFNSELGGSPMEKHFPHQNHFSLVNGHVTTSNDAAPGSASKTQTSSSTAETQPAATTPHNDKAGDLPDLFGAQASEFDSFLQPPASGNKIIATKKII